ncbi:MAG: hypothetical protein U0S12_15175 [Fimbriimonadales bacterium]
MPLSSIDSYLSTSQQFITHWTAVNADLGTALVLPTNYSVASLTTDRTNLQTKITAVVTADNALQIAAGARDLKKDPLRERVRQFRTALQSYFKGYEHVNALPRIPRFNTSEGDFMDALDDMANLWLRVNAILPVPMGMPIPLTLVGGYTQANFATDVAAIRLAYGTWNDALQGALVAREARNALLKPLRDRMAQYRLAVQSKYAAGSPMLESLPALTPARGSTPPAAVLSGNIVGDLITLSATVPSIPNLKHLSVRGCDGPRYNSAMETTYGTLMPGETVWTNNTLLTLPGAFKIFKVYVVTLDDNEKGSNSVKITHM